MKKLLFCLCALLLAVSATADTPVIPLDAFPKSTLQIATPDARLHPFNIWVANDDRHRMQGLMFVKELADDAGMFIVYPKPQVINLWMKNCYISMDMIFIRANGRVAGVAPNAKPMSEKTISSEDEVIAVLEVKAGTAARLNIRKGAIVMHPMFDSKAK